MRATRKKLKNILWKIFNSVGGTGKRKRWICPRKSFRSWRSWRRKNCRVPRQLSRKMAVNARPGGAEIVRKANTDMRIIAVRNGSSAAITEAVRRTGSAVITGAARETGSIVITGIIRRTGSIVIAGIIRRTGSVVTTGAVRQDRDPARNRSRAAKTVTNIGRTISRRNR